MQTTQYSTIQKLFLDFLVEKEVLNLFEERIRRGGCFKDFDDLIADKHDSTNVHVKLDPTSWIEQAFDWSLFGPSFDFWRKLDSEWLMFVITYFRPEWKETLQSMQRVMLVNDINDMVFFRITLVDIALALLVEQGLATKED